MRWIFFALVAATILLGAARFYAILAVDGVSALEAALLGVFIVLFGWIGASFWISCIGLCTRRAYPPGLAPPNEHAPPSASRTAIVIPVYNENARRVFAAVQAMRESVRAIGGAGRMDFVVLSDSSEPARWRAEEEEWRRLRDELGPDMGVFYRRRLVNIRRKAGNIADFCRNWGALYDYMIVLDADSVMTGEALTTLVRLMDANPRAGLIQTAPRLIGGETLFARIQQFASHVYGPLHAAGFAALQGPDGNYWGHNAIIRVSAFMENCGLPELPGRPPFGGEILSHDFVEAALLRRAGWDVYLAPRIEGSYEESPPTMIEYFRRDRRWCQGNLQHIRLIFAEGLRLPSRLHLALGAMAYLASPLWLILLAASAAEAAAVGEFIPVEYVGRRPVLASSASHGADMTLLLAAMLAMVYGPKLLSLALLLRHPAKLRAQGGLLKAAMATALESAFSTLFAPIAMLSHSWFIVNILAGRGVGWESQQRRAHRPPLAQIARAFAGHGLLAIVSVVALALVTPYASWSFAPALFGPIFAIPIVALTSSGRLGAIARRCGLHGRVSDGEGAHVVRRMRELATASID